MAAVAVATNFERTATRGQRREGSDERTASSMVFCVAPRQGSTAKLNHGGVVFSSLLVCCIRLAFSLQQHQAVVLSRSARCETNHPHLQPPQHRQQDLPLSRPAPPQEAPAPLLRRQPSCCGIRHPLQCPAARGEGKGRETQTCKQIQVELTPMVRAKGGKRYETQKRFCACLYRRARVAERMTTPEHYTGERRYRGSRLTQQSRGTLTDNASVSDPISSVSSTGGCAGAAAITTSDSSDAVSAAGLVTK